MANMKKLHIQNDARAITTQIKITLIVLDGHYVKKKATALNRMIILAVPAATLLAFSLHDNH